MIVYLTIASMLFAASVAWGLTGVNVKTPDGPADPATDYATLVKEGEAHLASGDLRRAEQAFTAAAAKNLPEEPNYRVLIKLAEVKCRQGSSADGLALVREFQCMLDVEAGKIQCFKMTEPRSLGERNDGLSPLCFERMCGEIYLAYYQNPSQATLREVEQLRRESARVERVCRAMTPDR